MKKKKLTRSQALMGNQNAKHISKKPEVGDYVWLRIPHSGVVSHVYGNGVRVDLDEIPAGTCMERFGFDEVDVITKSK